MQTRGQKQTDQELDYFEERHRQHVVASLSRRAQQFGTKLVPETQRISSIRTLRRFNAISYLE